MRQTEELALVRNPDIREASYQVRVSVNETHKMLARSVPGINFSYRPNYDCNSFLVNNTWTAGAERLSDNLIGILSIPEQLKTALGRLYDAVGIEPVPDKLASLDIVTLRAAIRRSASDWDNNRFDRLSEVRAVATPATADAAAATAAHDPAPQQSALAADNRPVMQ